MLGRTREFVYCLILLGNRYLSLVSCALVGGAVTAADSLSAAVNVGSKFGFLNKGPTARLADTPCCSALGTAHERS